MESNPRIEDWLHELYAEDSNTVREKQCDVTPQVSLDEFLEGHANHEVYSVFFDYFALGMYNKEEG